MNKLFEKMLTFIIFTSFFLISYVIFNINEVEYKIKEKRLIGETIIAEMTAPEWLINHSACERFKTYKKQDYGITKCINGDDVKFFKDKDSDYSFEDDYLYIFNKNKKKVLIIANVENKKEKDEINKLTENILADFSHLLGAKYEKNDTASNFKLIKRSDKKDTAQFIMIK